MRIQLISTFVMTNVSGYDVQAVFPIIILHNTLDSLSRLGILRYYVFHLQKADIFFAFYPCNHIKAGNLLTTALREVIDHVTSDVTRKP